MPSITELELYKRFNWARPVVPELTVQEKTEGYFCDPKPWTFEEPVLRLIEQMFIEIEEYFSKRNKPVEIAIYEISELFGELQVEMYCGNADVEQIVNKFKRLSRDVFANEVE